MYKQCHKAEAAEKGLLELLSRDSQQQQQQQQKQQKQQQQQQKQQQKQQQDQQQLDGSRATRDLLHINASYEDAVERWACGIGRMGLDMWDWEYGIGHMRMGVTD